MPGGGSGAGAVCGLPHLWLIPLALALDLMRPNTRITCSWLGAATLFGWPATVLAGGANPLSALSSAPFVAVLWGLSGLSLALVCYDALRAERLSAWLLLQAAFAMTAAILTNPTTLGLWARAARICIYLACGTAWSGVLAHFSALHTQSRLRRTQSLSQTLAQLAELDEGLDEVTDGQSDRFVSAYQSEAESIERLRTPGLAALLAHPRKDAGRRERMRAQRRYLDYSEQVAFEKAAGLLIQKEQLLVHISPHLKCAHVLNAWCDVQVFLFSIVAGLLAVRFLTTLYY